MFDQSGMLAASRETEGLCPHRFPVFLTRDFHQLLKNISEKGARS